MGWTTLCGPVSNLVGNGGCGASRARRKNVSDHVVRPSVGQISRKGRQWEDRTAFLTGFDEPDLFAGGFANSIFGLEPIDFGCEFAVDSLELVELGLTLNETVVLVQPCLDGEHEHGCTDGADHEEYEHASE